MNRPTQRLLPLLLLAVLGAPTVVAAQSAQQPPATTSADTATFAPAQDAQAAKEADALAKDKKLQESPYCLQHTGSLIRQTSTRRHCSAIGSAYSREDLQRTGATDIGDALRRLDSSIH